jgi:hypothetical protein
MGLTKRKWQDFTRDLLNEVHKYEDENIWFEVSVGEGGTIQVETRPTHGYPIGMCLDLQSYSTEKIIKEISSFAEYYQKEAAK